VHSICLEGGHLRVMWRGTSKDRHIKQSLVPGDALLSLISGSVVSHHLLLHTSYSTATVQTRPLLVSTLPTSHSAQSRARQRAFLTAHTSSCRSSPTHTPDDDCLTAARPGHQFPGIPPARRGANRSAPFRRTLCRTALLSSGQQPEWTRPSPVPPGGSLDVHASRMVRAAEVAQRAGTVPSVIAAVEDAAECPSFRVPRARALTSWVGW
jgi:hypothetical protein